MAKPLNQTTENHDNYELENTDRYIRQRVYG